MKIRQDLFAAVLVICLATLSATISNAQQADAMPQADNEYQVGATLYVQKAAEFRALSYQAFNLARWQLDS